MKLRQLLGSKGLEIRDGALRKLLERLYADEEVPAYVMFRTRGGLQRDGVQSFAFVVQGKKTWYAFIDGQRVSVKTAVKFIQSAEVKAECEMTKELKKQLLLEEI